MSTDNRGGDIRAENLTPERRSEIAKDAADTRWEWQRYTDPGAFERARPCGACAHLFALHPTTIGRRTWPCGAPECGCGGWTEPESQQASAGNVVPG
jgi:hypothetical protein